MKKSKGMFTQLKQYVIDGLYDYGLWILLSGGMLGLLGYKLLSLVPFMNYEQAVNLGSANLSSIKNEVLFAPVKGLQIFILKFTENDVYLRLASVAVAITAATLLYMCLRRWHTQRVSLITSLLFVTSTAFLQLGRSANTDVMYLCVIPALLLTSLWFLSKRNDKKMPLAAVLVALTLYIPGTWLFLLGVAFLLRKVIKKIVSALSLNIKLLSLGGFAITLLPLIYSIASNPSQIWKWAGIDIDDLSLNSVLDRLISIPDILLLRGFDDPQKWVIGTPLLDVFTLAMILLGIYAYRAGYYPSREKIIFGASTIALVLIILGGVAHVSLIIPALYLLAANGIAYLLQSWFTVFPKNPVARPLGIVLLLIITVMASSYHLQRYYTAWPDTLSSIVTLKSNS